MAITANTPSSSGGAVTSYGVSPALPSGLSLNTSTGVITGTPTAVKATATYTVTATNSAGFTTVGLVITVNAAVLPPTGLTYSTNPAVYTNGVAITANTPSSSGGSAVVSYGVSPSLPAGLALNISTGIITGTPTAVTATASYTVTATNSAGFTTASLTITSLPKPNAELFVPMLAHPGDTWMQASVPGQSGMSYLWTMPSGTSTGILTTGQGTGAIKFSTGGAVGMFQVQANVQNQAGVNTTATRTINVQTGTWLVKNGGLSTPRANSSSTILPSGRVLVVGGTSQSGLLATVEIYDPATGIWSLSGGLNTARAFHTATLLPNGNVLVVGGTIDNNGTPTKSSEIYDPASGIWNPTSDTGIARCNHTATLLPNGNVLVAGGIDLSGNLTADSEIFIPATGGWVITGNLNKAVAKHTATLLLNGTVLVAGGAVDTIGTPTPWAQFYNPSNGAWTTGGPIMMHTARRSHTATILPDGSVLVAGGVDTSGSNAGSVSSTEIYNPVDGNWWPKGSLGTARTYHTATLLLNGTVLVMGGATASFGGSTSSTEVYNPITGNWTTSGDLNVARSYHTAALIPDGSVMVAGGAPYSLQGSLGSSEIYSPATGTWNPTGGFGTASSGHTATLLPDGTVLVAGGGFNSPPLQNSQIYAPASRNWTPTATVGPPIAGHRATLLQNGTVLVTGGSDLINRATHTSEIYDPVTGIWTPTGSLGTGRCHHTATLLPNGKVLVAGGTFDNTGYPTSSAEIFNPSTGLWTPTGNLGKGRISHTATLLPNGTVLVAGGINFYAGGFPTDSSRLFNSEIYDPATGTWTPTGQMGANGGGADSAVLLPNGTVMVTGGIADINGNPSAEVQIYNPSTGNWWSYVPQLLSARYGHTATLLPNGTILVTGGYGNGTTLASSEIYDPVTNTWRSTGSLKTSRSGQTATLLSDGTVLVAFGSGDVVTEIYMP